MHEFYLCSFVTGSTHGPSRDGVGHFQGMLGWHEVLSGVGADGANSFGKESFVVTCGLSFS